MGWRFELDTYVLQKEWNSKKDIIYPRYIVELLFVNNVLK